MTRSAVSIFVVCGVFLAQPGVGQCSITLGKSVTLNGIYGTLRPSSGWDPSLPVASAASLVDGVFNPAAQVWQVDSVWWDATQPGSENNSIEIDLMSNYVIDSFIVQADDNDAYRIEYLDAANNWLTAYDIPIIGGFGLQTRPNPADNTEVFTLGSPVITNRLRFTAVSGDGFYSVSEIQAFGASVIPEPSMLAIWSLLGGLGMVAVKWQKRNRAA